MAWRVQTAIVSLVHGRRQGKGAVTIIERAVARAVNIVLNNLFQDNA
jgi:hypothetical protein